MAWVVEDGVLVVLDADEELAEQWSEGQRDDRDGDGRDDGPEYQCVPLPLPDLADECEWVFTGDVKDLRCRERDGCDVKDAAGEVDERNEQKKFERVDDVVGELRRDEIETQKKCGREAEYGGGAEDGVDADEQAERDAPGKFARGRSHAQQREDGQDDAAVEPVVMDWRGLLDDGWAARVHS